MKRSMKNTIEKILNAHGQLQPFREHDHYAVKIASSGLMPLSIEKHGETIVVAHLEQNGDLILDPDVEFVDLGGGDWLPTAIQHATGRYYRIAERAASGQWFISRRAMKDLQAFVRMWTKNLLAQGFREGKLLRAGPA